CVVAAGNDAGIVNDQNGKELKRNQHLRLEFPLGGGIAIIPIQLLDPRTNKVNRDKCSPKEDTPAVTFGLYYTATNDLTVRVLRRDWNQPIAGPPVGGVEDYDELLPPGFTMAHQLFGSSPHKAFTFTQRPNEALEHLQGTYVLTIETADMM